MNTARHRPDLGARPELRDGARRRSGRHQASPRGPLEYSQSYQVNRRPSMAKHWTGGCLWNSNASTISDGNSFEHVGEPVYARALAAEAHAIRSPRNCRKTTRHGGWISVDDSRGDEIARVPISPAGSPGTAYSAEITRRRKSFVVWL
jgi:hypothetical protein